MASHWLIPRDFVLVNKFWQKGDISPLRKLLACMSVGQFLNTLMRVYWGAEREQATQFFVIVDDTTGAIKPLHSVVLLEAELKGIR
jgi:hypothetical protein